MATVKKKILKKRKDPGSAGRARGPKPSPSGKGGKGVRRSR